VSQDEKTEKFRAMLAAAQVEDRRTPEQRARHEEALRDIAAFNSHAAIASLLARLASYSSTPVSELPPADLRTIRRDAVRLAAVVARLDAMAHPRSDGSRLLIDEDV
jgi:hypothetical protein